MSKPKDVVQKFCDAMVGRDAEALRPYLAADASYQNVGQPAVIGVDAIVEDLAGQFARFSDSYEYETVNVVAEGEIVMNERIDYVRGPDGTRHGLPVMGTFVVRDEHIVRWTDYWDSNLIRTMMSGEDYSALVPQR